MQDNISKTMELALEKSLNMIRERGETTTKEVDTYLLGLRQKGIRVSLSAPRVIMLLRKRGYIEWNGEKRGKAFVYVPTEATEERDWTLQEDVVEIPRGLFDNLAEQLVKINRTTYFFMRAFGISPEDYPPKPYIKD